MPEPLIFVGREKERERIHQLICEQDRSIICLKGRSQMGKTRLLRRVCEELGDSPNLYGAFHQFRSPSEDPLFAFVASLGELVRAAETKEGMVDKARRLVQALGSEPKKTALRMAGAAYRAARAGILGKAKEYFQYEEIVEEAVSILEEKTQKAGTTDELDELLAQARPAVITSYLGLLENLSDHGDARDRYVFAFDQMEHAPEGALDFLTTLVRELPPRCHLLFSLNIENPRGGEIWQKTHSELRANAVEIVELGPFGQEEIQQLIRARGKVVPPLDLLHDVERATGGRPLALDGWIQSEDFAEGRIRTDRRFQAYQLERLKRCTREAQEMVRALALIPKPFPRGIAEYATVFQTTALDVEGRLQELARQHLFLRTGDEYWFVHEEIQDTIRSDMAEAVRRELAQRLIVGLEAIDPAIMEKQTPYSLLAAALLPWTEDHEKTYAVNRACADSLKSTSEFLGAWEHYQRALQAAEALGDRNKEAYCLNQLGRISNLWGRQARALGYFEQGLTIYREVGDRPYEALTLGHIGGVYADLGQNKKALELYQQALAICREVGDRAGEASTLNRIGLAYGGLRQNDKTLEFFQQALAICREVGDRAGEAFILYNIGGVYADLGQKGKALELYEQALPIIFEFSDRAGKAAMTRNIALLCSGLGVEEEKVLTLYQHALSTSREVGDRAGEALTLHNIGGFYLDLGQNDKALEFFEQALAICRGVGDRHIEGTTLHVLGRVYASLGQNDKALEFFEQALAIYREVGDRAGQSATLCKIGPLAFNLGQNDKALKSFEEMVRTYSAKDKLPKAISAISMVKQFENVLEEINDPNLETYREFLANLHQAMHEQQGNQGKFPAGSSNVDPE